MHQVSPSQSLSEYSVFCCTSKAPGREYCTRWFVCPKHQGGLYGTIPSEDKERESDAVLSVSFNQCIDFSENPGTCLCLYLIYPIYLIEVET